MARTIVIALGGNALQENGGPATAEAQLDVARFTAKYIADIIQQGNRVVISHGNGPQVGRILLAGEMAAKATPPMPFDVCGAMSQGYTGYHLQQAIGDVFAVRSVHQPVVTVVTQTVVDADDAAFQNPSKPIGPFYSGEEAEELRLQRGYIVKEDAGRGWRRVVASPKPVRIVEIEAIKTLIDSGAVVIAVGGGGIPVIETDDHGYRGIAAVIDKDFGSECLAENINADILLILTAVDMVCLDFNKPSQRAVGYMTTTEAEMYITQGQFAPGSMLPKVQAAVKFAASGRNRRAIISSLRLAREALAGQAGTVIEAPAAVPDGNPGMARITNDSTRMECHACLKDRNISTRSIRRSVR
jgi:carbamate kinase